MELGGVGREPVEGRGALLAVVEVEREAALVARGAGDGSGGRALARGLLVDVVLGGAAVLLAKLDLEGGVAPRRAVREGDAVGLGGGDHGLEVGREALVNAERANELGAALGHARLDVVAVGRDLAGATEEERPGAATDAATGSQSVVGLKLLGRRDRAGAEDAVDLELGTELVQALLGGLDEDAGVAALDEGDESAERGGAGAAVDGQALGLLERLDLRDRVLAKDAVAVGAEAAGSEEVLQALDRVDTAVGSDEGVVANITGSKGAGSDLNVGDLGVVSLGRSLGARLCTGLTSRSTLAMEPVAGSTAPRARPTISSASSRTARLTVSGVGAATTERAARGARRVARAVRRIVNVLAVADGDVWRGQRVLVIYLLRGGSRGRSHVFPDV